MVTIKPQHDAIDDLRAHLSTVREVLERPFDAAAIGERAGGGNKVFKYISVDTCIRRLNEATENGWSFRVVPGETRFLDGGVRRVKDYEGVWQEIPQQVMVVLGELTIPGFGSRQGYGVQKMDAVLQSGEDLIKGAAGDALKRCAVSFGVAIDLYGPHLDTATPLQPDEIPGVTRGMPQAVPQAPPRPERIAQAAASRAPAAAPQNAPQAPSYPKVREVSNTASLVTFMRDQGFGMVTDFKSAIQEARRYGQEKHGVKNIVVGTGEVDPEHPERGPKAWPSDVAAAVAYWKGMEQKAAAQGVDSAAEDDFDDIPF